MFFDVSDFSWSAPLPWSHVAFPREGHVDAGPTREAEHFWADFAGRQAPEARAAELEAAMVSPFHFVRTDPQAPAEVVGCRFRRGAGRGGHVSAYDGDGRRDRTRSRPCPGANMLALALSANARSRRPPRRRVRALVLHWHARPTGRLPCSYRGVVHGLPLKRVSIASRLRSMPWKDRMYAFPTCRYSAGLRCRFELLRPTITSLGELDRAPSTQSRTQNKPGDSSGI